MLLGLLKNIDILGDALDLKVVALHLVVQRQKVEGVTTRESRLEVRN